MGTRWDHSRVVEFDNNGKVADGALAYFYNANTTTPRATYQDAGLSTPHTHPVEADGNGRWPLVFLQFGSFDQKVTTEGGTQLFYDQNIPNPEPFSEDFELDETTIWQTGMIGKELLNSTRTGFVRLNGRTIGNAASSATERANADTEDLFAYLWNGLTNTMAAVSGGRGGSAAADYAAGKRITLPDWRAVSAAGFDDMGNTAASLLGSAPVVLGDTVTSGSVLGANTHTLTGAQLPVTTPAGSVAAPVFTGGATTITATGSVAITDPGHFHTTTPTDGIGDGGGPPNNGLRVSGGAGQAINSNSKTTGITAGFTGNAVAHTPTGTNSAPAFTGTPFGSGSAHNILSRAGLVTWFIKL